MKENNELEQILIKDETITLADELKVVFHLSLPGVLAQISEIIMQYIDAAMVGLLGASASASIGLVSSTTWLFFGLISACAAGFSVQCAHAIGAQDYTKAKSIFKQSIIACLIMSAIYMSVGLWVAPRLPLWLKAEQTLWKDSINYFLLFSFFIPVRQLTSLFQGMLQCSGNMKIPSILVAVSCLLDVVFNYLLIFPTREISLFGNSFTMYGAGLGVLGAQLGTSLSVLVNMLCLFYFAVIKSKKLSLINVKGSWIPNKEVVHNAVKISAPMGLEQSALCLAQIVSTRIIAPLGTIAIAAHSFAITAESICYMPGYGTGAAATTLVGQSIGARRPHLAKRFAWVTTYFGIAVMSVTAFLMYFLCPYVFKFLTPDLEVQKLGISILRIELFAEPLFAASIVITGALRGAGDTLVPGILNLVSIWGVRIPIAYFMTRTIGLAGAWYAMAIEICFRGILFIIRLKRERWLKQSLVGGNV